MNTSKSALERALDDHSHLDLTPWMVENASTQMGGGGFSDVFLSQMHRGWQPRSNPYTQILLNLSLDEVRYSSGAGPARHRKIDNLSDHLTVAVKRLRFWTRPISKVEKEISKEIKIWAKLSHLNVLPFLGFVLNWNGSIYPSLVSPWVKNGNLGDYMKENEVNVPVTAAGIASGLQYLHSQNVVHADLKCGNVLLSATLQPLLIDFGLSRQIITSVSTSTTASSGTLRWKAPELVGEGETKANEQSDIWALGMTILELLTKDVPYNGMNDGQVVRNLLSGSLPAPLDGLTQRSPAYQRLWSVCQDCWTMEPSMRPTMMEVLRRLRELSMKSVTQFTQVLDIFSYLNLSHIMKRSDSFPFFSIPILHFNSSPYRENRQDVSLLNLREILNSSRAPEGSYDVRVKLASPGPLSSLIRYEPSLMAEDIATLNELSHPNLLPFLGYVIRSNESVLFAFPDVNTPLYPCRLPEVIDILPKAEGIASGLAYLHSRDVVCSILTGVTIWLAPTLRPLIQLTELWLSKPDTGILEESYQWKFKLHCQWMAVEIFDDRHLGFTNKETDVWAFGMTILELFINQFPYGDSTPNEIVIENLKHHRLPPPPDDISIRPQAEQELWILVQECWNFEPSERPTAQGLHERIQGIIKEFPHNSSDTSSSQ